LPNFQAHGVPLTWGPLQAQADPLLSPLDSTRTNDTTDAKGQASWPFQTSHDPGDPKGEQLNQVDYMPVSVHRPEIDQARSRLTTVLLGFIPSLLRPFVSALFAPYLDGLQSRLNLLLDARGTGAAMLVYHDKAKPTPAPSTTPAPSGACSPSPVAAGSYSGTFTMSLTTVLGTGANARANVTTDKGTGPVNMTVSSDGSLTGTFSYQVNEDEVINDGVVQDEMVSTYTVSGSTVGGTACNMVLTLGTAVTTSCHDRMLGDCSGGSSVSLAGLQLPIGCSDLDRRRSRDVGVPKRHEQRRGGHHDSAYCQRQRPLGSAERWLQVRSTSVTCSTRSPDGIGADRQRRAVVVACGILECADRGFGPPPHEVRRCSQAAVVAAGAGQLGSGEVSYERRLAGLPPGPGRRFSTTAT
jgi:hypothetical protein